MANIVLNAEGSRVLLMGNEAVARGAIEAGIEIAAGYPGTPSSEVLETLWNVCKETGIYVEWSTNEKIAFEVAAGAAVAGARALCTMKNAGLNVAMDTFVALPYTGVKGGLVVLVADDPGAHYSSTEQDTRPLAAYAKIPCLEPCDQQEACDMTREAFALSEALELPIMVRTVTRLSHASGDVVLGPQAARESKVGFNKHYGIPFRWNVYGAPGPVSKHKWLNETIEKARTVADKSAFNSVKLAPNGSKLGILASGVGYSYVYDVLSHSGYLDKVNLCKVGFVNPVPEGAVRELLINSTHILVVEEGEPYLERHIRGMTESEHCAVFGKLAGPNQVLTPWDELNPNVVARALEIVSDTANAGLRISSPHATTSLSDLIAPRSSTLCPGCPHLGSYWALKQALAKEPGVHIVNGDIGCYEQGGYGLFGQNIGANTERSKRYPMRTPYEILDTLYVMGSGLGMAQGQSHLKGRKGKAIAVSGDSTFFHAILPSIANASITQADVTYLVLDNRWTAMTGHQPSPRTGSNPIHEPLPVIDIESTVRALGINRVFRVSAFNVQEAQTVISNAMAEQGPSVVVLEGECALQVARRKETKSVPKVNRLECTGCKTCIQLGCSAVMYDSINKVAGIDDSTCVGCDLCVSVCPFNAIMSSNTTDASVGSRNNGGDSDDR